MSMIGATQINLLDVYGIDKQEREQGTKPGQLASNRYPSVSETSTLAQAKRIFYGWFSNPPQMDGMSTLWVDQLHQQPISSTPFIPRAPQIQRSLYEQIAHYRLRSNMFVGSAQRPLRDDSNTLLDLRTTGAPRIKPQPTAGGGNLPGGVRMAPPLQHETMLNWAWRVPRFSTEPYTIVPQGTV